MKRVKQLIAILMSAALLTVMFAIPVNAQSYDLDECLFAGDYGKNYNFCTYKDDAKISSAVSSDQTVVRIENDGKWKAIKPGEATVTVYYENYAASIIHIKVINLLQKSDFNFNKKVDGFSNYYDHVKNYKGKDGDERLKSIVQTKSGTFGDYKYLGDYSSALSRGWTKLKGVNLNARGIKIGDSKEKVFDTFGRWETSALGTAVLQNVDSSDDFADMADEFDKPIEKITYEMYQENHYFTQRYYFNEQGKVCMIAWKAISA